MSNRDENAPRKIKWVDNALAQSEALSQRSEDIQTYAAEVHKNLWDELLETVEYLIHREKRFKGCGTNGQANDRIFYKVNSQGGSHRIELHIKLSKKRDEIRAHGEKVDLTFQIDKLADGTVGLKYQGLDKTYDEAAELILQPFLFPELSPQK